MKPIEEPFLLGLQKDNFLGSSGGESPPPPGSPSLTLLSQMCHSAPSLANTPPSWVGEGEYLFWPL